ncbi:DUF4139 domain-containing protein [Roseovarius sp. LXJ103]|uniref:DUF4139 domain-containing protein n=1 Tax=Roseovarius carneus TaxID=2853164 RepID=UPI0015E80115|nr:hypothetical protein [Roseovarius carneus]MBZ8118140.1 DUF4139 domain-containing protein [Roseovarius carneus]
MPQLGGFAVSRALRVGMPGQTASRFTQRIPFGRQTRAETDPANDTGEIILRGRAMLYLDGGFVGETRADLIAVGDEAELFFGLIESLHLTRRVLNREEGDRGVITRSNDLTEQVEIEDRNLSGETWPLRVLDQVPCVEGRWMDQPAGRRISDQRLLQEWREWLTFSLPKNALSVQP